MFAQNLLEGRRVLITGGGTGLGFAMAERFAELGADIAICGRRVDVLDDAARRIEESTGTHVSAVACDIRDPEQVFDLFKSVSRSGPIDILVNNAAATFIARTETLSHRAADAILNVTLHGALYCTLEAGRRWIGSGHDGVVLSILSTSTRTGRAFTVPSAIAKSGLLAMTRSLAVEWGSKGIRCVAIAPGPFPTEGSTKGIDPTTDRGFSSAAPMNPLGRIGRHEELANLAAFLVSPEAAYINGEMIAIDGGQHLRTSGAEDLLSWSDAQWEQIRAR